VNAATALGEAGPGARVVTVSQLLRALRGRVESEPAFASVWVRGEISTYKLHAPSGHRYLTLREGAVSVRAVMFQSAARSLRFEPEAGMDVLARGSVTIYERDGSAELILQEIVPAGVGAQFLALKALRERLEGEGLFDPARKRPLPAVPRRLGVVTSLSGAALRDVVAVVRRRMPTVDVLVAPCQVQGETAPAEIVAAVERIGRAGVDVVIVGRGGGAAEDLQAFNAEVVVRAVAACPVPVIAAVGHQTDWTLVDHAADRRAPTPSAAAELAVPDVLALRAALAEARLRLGRALRQRHRRERLRLEALLATAALRRPRARLEREAQRLDAAVRALEQAVRRRGERARFRLVRAAERLQALSPLAVLARGYAVVRRPDGSALADARAAVVGEALIVQMRDGRLDVGVRAVRVEAERASGDGG
jgi:exodeoxyribonuclease VII large subunit